MTDTKPESSPPTEDISLEEKEALKKTAKEFNSLADTVKVGGEKIPTLEIPGTRANRELNKIRRENEAIKTSGGSQESSPPQSPQR